MKVLRASIGLLLVTATSMVVGYGQTGLSEQAASTSGSRSLRASDASLPKDVYPDSRNRLPSIKREELDELGKKVFDTAGGSGASTGATGIRIYSPPLADSLVKARDWLKAAIDPRFVELAILVATREMDGKFEWNIHEPLALQAGLEPEIIAIIKYRQPLKGLAEKDAVIIQLGREMFRNHKVSSDTFARALKLNGKHGLVNVVSLMCHVAGTNALENAFDQQLPPGQKQLLPIP